MPPKHAAPGESPKQARTLEDFDAANTELWEAMKQWQHPEILVAQLAYAELLARRLFPSKD